jgi:hypothetical protein
MQRAAKKSFWYSVLVPLNHFVELPIMQLTNIFEFIFFRAFLPVFFACILVQISTKSTTERRWKWEVEVGQFFARSSENLVQIETNYL